MRDAHKEMHWPEPAVIGLQKPEFTYSVLPKRIDVQPTWEREKAKRLKVEDPLQRLYKGFVEAGMGNYTSPMLLVNYADLRARERERGVWNLRTRAHGADSCTTMTLWGKACLKISAATPWKAGTNAFSKKNTSR